MKSIDEITRLSAEDLERISLDESKLKSHEVH